MVVGCGYQPGIVWVTAVVDESQGRVDTHSQYIDNQVAEHHSAFTLCDDHYTHILKNYAKEIEQDPKIFPWERT